MRCGTVPLRQAQGEKAHRRLSLLCWHSVQAEQGQPPGFRNGAGGAGKSVLPGRLMPLRGDAGEAGAENAVRCDGSCSTLRRPMQRAAPGIAPQCAIGSERVGWMVHRHPAISRPLSPLDRKRVPMVQNAGAMCILCLQKCVPLHVESPQRRIVLYILYICRLWRSRMSSYPKTWSRV